MLAAWSFPAPGPREVRQVSDPGTLLLLPPWEHQATSPLSPTTYSRLNAKQVRFSLQVQANSVRNMFGFFFFGGPDRNLKPLLCLRKPSQWLEVFSSMFEAISEFLNSSLEV